MASLEIEKLPIPTPKQSQLITVFRHTISYSSYTDCKIYPNKSSIGEIDPYFKLTSASVYLTASAAVANRQVFGGFAKYGKEATLQLPMIMRWQSGDVAANEQGRILLGEFGAGIGATQAITNIEAVAVAEINNLILYGIDYLILGVLNGQAGDVYHIQAEFEYLNHKLGIMEK